MERAIFILGSGMHTAKSTESGTKPSWSSRMRQNAGAHLFMAGGYERIYTTGGEVYKGYPTLAEQGKVRLTKAFGIQGVKTSKGNNTLEEIKKITELVKQNNWNPNGVSVISNEYHIVAKDLAEAAGFNFVSAEEILASKHSLYERVIGDIKSSFTYRQLITSQELRLKVFRLPFGKLIYQIADWFLKRDVKITPFDPSGLQKL
jgi:hypothetical protein